MVYYLTMLAASLPLAWMSDRCAESPLRRRLWLAASFLPLFLISAIRYNVTADYGIYAQIYGKIGAGSTNRFYEPGFTALNWLLTRMTSDSQWIFVVCGALVAVLFGTGFELLSTKRWLSMYLFVTMSFFCSSMNNMRQYIAVGLLFIACRFVMDRRLWPFLACVAVAALFHKTALVFLPVYFLFQRTYRWYWYAILGGVLASTNFYYKPLIRLFATLLGYQDYFLPENQHYLQVEISQYYIALTTLVLVWCVLYYRALIAQSEGNRTLFHAAVALFLVYTACWWVPLISRLAVYFSVLYIILIPRLIACEKRPWLRRAMLLGVVVFFFLFWLRDMHLSNNDLDYFLPYQTIFNK